VWDSARQYRGTARDFLIYLGENSFVCELVQRLRFFRSFDPLPLDGHLLSRPHGQTALIRQLRYYLHEVSVASGIPTRIVPHQLRHTYASEMVRSGVTLPAVMKLLGHADPGMTMRYVQITSNDLHNEFQMARSQPRYLAPHPKAPTISLRDGRHMLSQTRPPILTDGRKAGDPGAHAIPAQLEIRVRLGPDPKRGLHHGA